MWDQKKSVESHANRPSITLLAFQTGNLEGFCCFFSFFLCMKVFSVTKRQLFGYIYTGFEWTNYFLRHEKTGKELVT